MQKLKVGFLKKFRAKILRCPNIWAIPEMTVAFRAEVMPGKNREERAFRVQKVLNNGRVTLYHFAGKHRESEFEPLKNKRTET